MKKRILTVLLAVCLVFALGTVSALADEGVDTLQELQEALEDATSETSIYLAGDITVNDTVTLNLKGATINTKGFSIVVSGGNLTVTGNGTITNDVAGVKNTDAHDIFTVTRGKLTVNNGLFNTVAAQIINAQGENTNVTIVDGSFNFTGTDTNLKAVDSKAIIAVSNGASLSFYSGNIDADEVTSDVCALYGVYAATGADVTIGRSGSNNGPSITTGCAAIGFNNTTSSPAVDLTIYGGEFKSSLGEYDGKFNSVLYLSGQANINIYGGSFTTEASKGYVISIPYAKVGLDLNISGGTFDASDGLYVIYTTESSSTKADDNSLSISGGTFTAGTQFAQISDNNKFDDFITGGTFKTSAGEADNSVSAYFPDGLSLTVDTNGTVGYDTSISEARIGNTYYKTLADAIEAAQDNETVTLLKDVSVSAADLGNTKGAITITEDIILDGDTHTISITSIDTGATPSAINIQNSANVTLKDLTIDSDGAKHGLNINNNANVTLENVKILDSAQYAIVCNSSKLTVNGLYTKGNAWGINVDSKTADVKSNVIINNATINEKDSIVFENTNNAGSDVTINDGTFNNIKKQGGNTTGIDVDVNGGTFGMDITEVANEYPNYQVRIGNNYSYYNDADDALNAAGTTGVVTYVGPSTTDIHDVTLYYDKDHVVVLEVEDGDIIYLPSGYFDGKHIEGWDERYEGNYKPGARVTVERDMYFTVILRNAAYDIVIDDDILHGDIWTSPRSEAEAGDTVHVYADPDAGYVLEDLSVTNRSGRYELKLTRVSANHYTFTMPAYDVYVTAEFTSDGFPFDDVRSNQWFYDAVYYVWANDLMEGVDYDEFNPNGTMTRAMFWAVLGRIDGETITGSDWADEARDWAMSEGVSDGTNPNGLVTREQMVTMLWRYAGERDGSGNLSRYTDGDKVAQYATEAMRWALGNGIIEGITATTLEPQATATRAQCAAIFMRYYE